MKRLQSLTAILFPAALLFFCACSNSPESKTDRSDAKTSVPPANTTAPGEGLTGNEGSFSYTINGERVETVAGVQHGGLFINEISNDAANGILTIEVTPNGKYFEFHIANSGTTSIGKYQPSVANDAKSKVATYTDPKITGNLYSDAVTVTITSINSDRVTGTFSGTFTQDKSYGNETAKITDGSFNLSFKKG
jgi:hypothetical protein